MSRLLIVLSILTLFIEQPVTAAPVQMPDPGVLAQTRFLSCGNSILELRFYDYTPPDEKYFKSLGVGLEKEKNFAQIMWGPERQEATAAETKVYLDGNVDGVVDEVLSFEEAAKRYPGTWCDVMNAVRRKVKGGRPKREAETEAYKRTA